MTRPVPLAGTLARLAGHRDAEMHFDGVLLDGVPRGWRSAAGTLRDPRALDRLLAAVGRQYATEREDVRGSLLADAWSMAVAAPLVAAVLVDRRLPLAAPDALALRFGADGHPGQTGFLSARFACLPGDPGGGHPTAVVLRSEDELLDRLARTCWAHLEPMVGALRDRTRRPRSGLQRCAADQLAGAFLFGGEMLGRREEAWDLGRRCLERAGALAVPPAFRVLRHAGRERAMRVRAGCCLLWRTPGSRGCFTCPLTRDDERLRRMEG